MQQLYFIKYKRTVFKDLNKRHIKRPLLKDLENEKCTYSILFFSINCENVRQKGNIFCLKANEKVNM